MGLLMPLAILALFCPLKMRENMQKQRAKMSLFPEILSYPQHKQAPLPFMGQKKNFLESFRRVLLTKNIDKDTIFLDVFGGSGLLSHHLKIWYPNNAVIWNDFDNFAHRLENIKITQEIKQELQKINLIEKEKRIEQSTKQRILEVFCKYIAKYGEDKIDFITFSTYFLFCGNYAHNFEEFQKEVFYNRFSAKELNAQGYLEGVEREQMDFRELLAKYANAPAFLILDPPYLQTQIGNYRSHFLLKDFLYLCKYIKGKDFVMFSSQRSDTTDLFDFLEIPYKKAQASLNLGNSKDLLLF